MLETTRKLIMITSMTCQISLAMPSLRRQRRHCCHISRTVNHQPYQIAKEATVETRCYRPPHMLKQLGLVMVARKMRSEIRTFSKKLPTRLQAQSAESYKRRTWKSKRSWDRWPRLSQYSKVSCAQVFCTCQLTSWMEDGDSLQLLWLRPFSWLSIVLNCL